jgi:hypothetical protein
MKRINLFVLAGLIGIAFMLAGSNLLSAQDKYALKAPNGLSFEDIRGYETWQVVAPSYRPDKKEVRYILGNATLVEAYKKGASQKGIAFPDGSILVKVSYSEKMNPAFPAALEPDALQRIEFMQKDAKRFSATGGWGYARFVYNPASNTYTPYGKDASFADECYQCHTLVKDRDYVFTKYPVR